VAGIGIFVAWLGYSLGFFGLDQIRGGNNGLLSLMRPGKFKEQPSDGGGNTDTASVPGGLGSAVKTSGNPGGVNIWKLIPPPKGAPPGNYRVNQDGTIQVQAGKNWTTYHVPGQIGALPPPA
jgi:hypothetical protein